MKFKATVMDENTIKRAINRLSHEIIEHNEGLDDLCLIGIRTRGVPIAERIKKCLSEQGSDIETGVLDITLHRDDLTLMNKLPCVKSTEINFEITGKKVILCDDVLYTGRTIRAAIDTIMEIGRPTLIKLLVLIDRGHRELPIRADFVGKNIPTAKSEQVVVKLKETDGVDLVEIYTKE